MRGEAEVFDELRELCTQAGFVHALSFLCFRDTFIGLGEEVDGKSLLQSYSKERLIRTEIATLAGLMLSSDVDWTLPGPEVIDKMAEGCDALLKELHSCLSISRNFEEFQEESDLPKVLEAMMRSGASMREAAFYGGESAYISQYVDLAGRKYRSDDEWLLANKGFKIEHACRVVDCIREAQSSIALEHLEYLKGICRKEWTMQPAFNVSTSMISEKTGLSSDLVRAVMDALSYPSDSKNESFKTLNDFNQFNAYPIIKTDDENWWVLTCYSLAEALYETPYFWMMQDGAYKNVSVKNRGEFTEEFLCDRLRSVFGEKNVYPNVDVKKKGAKDKAGEIDVLVLFADRAIVLQAKSKKFTLEARKGNDNQIQNDFQKAIQHSYDQAYLCATFLNDPDYEFFDAAGKSLEIEREFSEIYPFCIVSDHYPAMTHQVSQFLKYQTTDVIQKPFVLDVFLLDVLAEFLTTPIYFLAYINKHAEFFERVLSSHELTVFAYHLKRNLWMDDEYHMMMLEDDICADLDAAMLVRRDNQKGQDTPQGILTHNRGTPFSKIIEQIEAEQSQLTVGLGFQLFGLSGNSIAELNEGINRITAMTRVDGKVHDFVIGFGDAHAGLTIHCRPTFGKEDVALLQGHCELRKYSQKAGEWYGIIIDPFGQLMFGMGAKFPWEFDEALEAEVQKAPAGKKKVPPTRAAAQRKKLGRNQPCHCGSGRKYKKCHMAFDG